MRLIAKAALGALALASVGVGIGMPAPAEAQRIIVTQPGGVVVTRPVWRAGWRRPVVIYRGYYRHPVIVRRGLFGRRYFVYG